MIVKVGSRVNIWIVEEGPRTYRAEIAATKDSPYGTVPVAIRVVAPGGQLSTPLLSGSFVIIHDQTAPDWEATPLGGH